MTSDYQVAVVGFGPSGAVMTSLLGRAGIRTLAIDRSRTVYDRPRAIAMDHEILRLFDNLGVADRVLPHVAPFPASQHFGVEGQLIRRIDMVPEPYPLGYTPSMVFSQPPVEEALREHAGSYDAVEVLLGTELIGLEQSDDRVRVDLVADDGGSRSVKADYVVACDGAGSSVRQQLGIALEDLVFDEPWLVVDALVGDEALPKLPTTAAQFCDPARPTTFIIGPGNHRGWEIMLLPGEDPRAAEQPARVWELLARWITPDDATLWRAASYRFHALLAQEWRRGRVLLAGDAAHQQPPFIGQGMCQGLRDVANLAWRLDRIIKRQSSDTLLETYVEERKDHVRELTSRIKAIGQVICERDPDAARARDARVLAEGGGQPRTITRQEIVPPLRRGLLASRVHPARGLLFPQPWIGADGARVLLDRAAGVGWRMVIDGRSDLPLSAESRRRAEALGMRLIWLRPDDARAAGTGASCAGEFVELDGVVARWFDTYECRAAIVRPDHYVFGVAEDEAALAGIMAAVETRLR